MRADMAKVIVERPRIKGRAWRKPKGYKKLLQNCGTDGSPHREGIKRCWQGGSKFLNEHLGPLRRYLDSQVGRPWDKVFSEICTHINGNSAVQDHVRDHVEDYVVVHVLFIDGVPCNGEGGWHYGRPLREMGWKPWYVCPRSGLLRRVKSSGRKRPHRPKKEEPPRYIRVGDSLQCRFIENGWHLVTLKPLPLVDRHRLGCDEIDILLKRSVANINPREAQEQYGAEVYAVAKRRLARRELRQYPIPSQYPVPSRLRK